MRSILTGSITIALALTPAGCLNDDSKPTTCPSATDGQGVWQCSPAPGLQTGRQPAPSITPNK